MPSLASSAATSKACVDQLVVALTLQISYSFRLYRTLRGRLLVPNAALLYSATGVVSFGLAIAYEVEWCVRGPLRAFAD